MYPDEFDYYKAEEIQEALNLLEKYSDQAPKVLAGGHSLLPAMKTGLSSPEVLIDIGDIYSMREIKSINDTLSIGGATRYSTLADSPIVAKYAPVLADAARQIGDVQVRNRGTIGGNLAHSDPASDLPGAVLASDAILVVEGPDGERSVPASEFFLGMYTTNLADNELLTRIEVPLIEKKIGAYAKRPSPSSGYAMVGVAAQLTTDGDTVESIHVGANGVMTHGVRLKPVEEALLDSQLNPTTIEMAAEHAGDDLDTDMMMSDLHASNEFRAQLLKVYTKRALSETVDQNNPSVAAD